MIERLGEGWVQIRALEIRVVEVKNWVRIAVLQNGCLKQGLVDRGLNILSDNDTPQNFVERLQRKPPHHGSLTASQLARISAPPLGLHWQKNLITKLRAKSQQLQRSRRPEEKIKISYFKN